MSTNGNSYSLSGSSFVDGSDFGRPPVVVMVEVAKRARVSQPTVSRVLSGDPTMRVSPATRKRILSVARELNYVQDARAQRLRRGGMSPILGVLVDGLWGVYRPRFIHHLSDELFQAGKEVLLGVHHGDPAMAQQQVNTFRSYRTFAVLRMERYMSSHEEAVSMLDEARGECGPCLSVSFLGSVPHVASVVIDIRGVFDDFLRMLVVDERRYVVLTGKRTPASDYIGPLFADILRQHPSIEGEAVWVKTEDPDEFARRVVPLLHDRSRQGATAVLTNVDSEAAVIAQGLQEIGVSVPDEVAVVGYGNHEASRFSKPRISTFDVLGTLPDMALKAFELLNGLNPGDELEPREYGFRPKLIVRDSFVPRVPT